ncbi:hypothetical protein CLOSTASPAR_01720 [[Clostridium] asparagiforme DSM 15981]|uniref:Uncharacterized protein n=1 Tax=[Clostridium] asparagiforme DSM 15981 TaxID=518636 RepID=C0CXJ6_9FIRM|nr:hypothetical protein CLOSTASPAR_01720 [[Clostridium] asparagiforme DSM 15981]
MSTAFLKYFLNPQERRPVQPGGIKKQLKKVRSPGMMKDDENPVKQRRMTGKRTDRRGINDGRTVELCLQWHT